MRGNEHSNSILTVNCDIDDVGPGGGGSQHTSSGDTGSVMRVNVDGEVGVFLANSTNKATQSLLSVTE